VHINARESGVWDITGIKDTINPIRRLLVITINFKNPLSNSRNLLAGKQAKYYN